MSAPAGARQGAAAAVLTVGGAPDAELSARVGRIEVEERLGRPTRFWIHLAVGIAGPAAAGGPAAAAGGDLPLLADDRLSPGSEIAVFVPGSPAGSPGPECLVKGVVVGGRARLVNGGAGSELVVEGADLSVLLDREDRAAVWEGVRASDAVTAILLRHGLLPDVEGTDALYASPGSPLVQRGTDLAFIRRLARRSGRLFWLSTGSAGVTTAHFKRPPVGEAPRLVLSINRPGASLGEVEIAWNVERPAEVEARQLDLGTKDELDGSSAGAPLPLLGSAGLGDLSPGGPRSTHLAVPAGSAGELAARAEAAAVEAGFFVRASLTTDRTAAGGVLRAHTTAALAGAGSRHSGAYLVSAVHHTLDAVRHTMAAELIRNAWG